MSTRIDSSQILSIDKVKYSTLEEEVIDIKDSISTGGSATNKVDKITPVQDDILLGNSDGSLKDSGHKISDFETSTGSQTKVDTAITLIKDNVAADGNTLAKLRNLITGLQTLMSVTDVNFDTLQEVVTAIKSDEGMLASITSDKLSITNIVDDLIHTDITKPLSANQGLVLKGLLDTLTTAVSNKVNTVAGMGLSTNDYSSTEKDKVAMITNAGEGRKYLNDNGTYSTILEGIGNAATGNASHAEGIGNAATGDASHAEGVSNTAVGPISHVEGYANTSAEDVINCLIPIGLNADGKTLTFAPDEDLSSLALGDQTVQWYNNKIVAIGMTSRITAFDNTAKTITFNSLKILSTLGTDVGSSVVIASKPQVGKNHHKGYGCNHLENIANITKFHNGHIEGANNLAIYGLAYNVSAVDNVAKTLTIINVDKTVYTSGGLTPGVTVYAEINTVFQSIGTVSLATGNVITLNTTSTLTGITAVYLPSVNATSYGCQHVEGIGNIVTGLTSHIEGQTNIITGTSSHAEGTSNIVTGGNSHTEGNGNVVTGIMSHAEGQNNTVTGDTSHIEGGLNKIVGSNSHVEGFENVTNGSYAHAEGVGNLATNGTLYNITAFDDTAKTITLDKITGLSIGSLLQIKATGIAITDVPITAINGLIVSLNTTQTIGSYWLKVILKNSLTASIHAEGNNTLACGNNSHAEGDSTTACGNNSHAEGSGNTASGSTSHAEGTNATASGSASHAEGCATIASGNTSHAEGSNNTASGNYSHAEGANAIANGDYSHAEGYSNTTNGSSSHAEGYNNTASGNYSHAEGTNNIANGSNSHAEGQTNTAKGSNSHAEGYNNSTADYSHAEGIYNLAVCGTTYNITAFDNTAKTITLNNVTGLVVGKLLQIKVNNDTCILDVPISAINGLIVSITTTCTITANWIKAILKSGILAATHAEGNGSVASGANSHAEGANNAASGANSHAEGDSTTASGSTSHAEGYYTTASGDYSHAEGGSTVASGGDSHAEGSGTVSSGAFSHAEGFMTQATGIYSHAEGSNSTASGNYSHAEGSGTTASGSYSHAEGGSTQATVFGSHTQGQFNKALTGTATTYSSTADAFVIGNGTSSFTQSNAFRVTFAGATYGLSAFNSTGADYAEYFEWLDDNPDKEDRVGYFVTLDGEKIRKANSTDSYIVGIISAMPSVIGDSYQDDWNYKYLTDTWGRPQYQYVDVAEVTKVIHHDAEYTIGVGEDGSETKTLVKDAYDETIVLSPARKDYVPQLNPLWDATKEYVPREKRPEWSAVGMMGKLLVRDDGACVVNGYCKSNDAGIATTATEGYKVIARISSNIIKILVK